MLEKIDIYDAMTSLMHGTLFLMAGYALFPYAMKMISPLEVSEFASSIAFVCIAYFVGQVITSVSSMIQPFLFWTWGGMPSKLAFEGKIPDKYLSYDTVKLVRAALQKTSQNNLSDSAIFNKAMSIARKADGSLSERHNRMYAYNRVTFCNLILVLALFVLSCFYGQGKGLCCAQIICIVIGFLFMLLLHWHRAKQRAFYYVREVIVVAEREVSGGV
jgi:hypothetical protein